MTHLRHSLYCRVKFAIIFCLSILPVQSVVSDPIESVSIVEQNQIKSVGDSVELHCKLNNLNNRSLLWAKINKNDRSSQFFIAMNTNTVSKDRFAVKYDNDTSTYTLRISPLEASDTGIYQCQMVLGSNDKVTADVILDIEHAPEISPNLPKTLTVFDGEPVDLQCQVDGFPAPIITWQREYGDILPRGYTWLSSDILSIESVDKYDRGNYICTAVNRIGSARAIIKLNVEFAPVVDTPRPKIGQARGYDADLQCHIVANPMPIVIWLKDGKKISTEAPRTSEEEFIHVHKVSVIDRSDYGRYTCRVVNKCGEAEAIVELFEMDYAWIN